MTNNSQVILVTGATRGIGKAIAENFCAQGDTVIITGRSELAFSPLPGTHYMQCEMSNLEQVKKLPEKILEKFGRIDVLVNNAGITNDQLFIRMKDEDWTQVIDINLNALFHLTQPIVKAMSKQKSGSIINMSSVVGLHGNPAQVNYCTSKAGIIGFTKALAKEYGRRGIRVNAIAPGFISTEMTDKLPEEIKNKYKENIPLGDFGSVTDVAELVCFLAKSANYITGQVIQVDGGLFM